jgi:hypothetical protein
MAASSVSWLMPRVVSRGQAIGVGLTSERLRATAASTQLLPGALRIRSDTGLTHARVLP